MQHVAAKSASSSVLGRFRVFGPAEPSLFDSLFPAATWPQRLLASLAMVALVAVLARVRFFLPDNPVPVTLQTFGVLMTGAVLGWRWGLLSAVFYYLAGMAGVPVFQGGNSGWQYVTGATGGYLLGFILASVVAGYMAQHGWSRGRALWPITVGAIVVYIPALIWLSAFDLGWPAPGKLFSSAVYPFVPGDLLKLTAAGLATGVLWRIADLRSIRARKDTDTRVR